MDRKFDLTGMDVGDWFLGCPTCGMQHEKNTACYPFCEGCRNPLGPRKRLNLYTVTYNDVGEDTSKEVIIHDVNSNVRTNVKAMNYAKDYHAVCLACNPDVRVSDRIGQH